MAQQRIGQIFDASAAVAAVGVAAAAAGVDGTGATARASSACWGAVWPVAGLGCSEHASWRKGWPGCGRPSSNGAPALLISASCVRYKCW